MYGKFPDCEYLKAEFEIVRPCCRYSCSNGYLLMPRTPSASVDARSRTNMQHRVLVGIGMLQLGWRHMLHECS